MSKNTNVALHEPMVMSFNLAQSSLIEASAGTGKTYTITKLILRILLGSGTSTTSLARPLRLTDILVVTFTEAATADLRQRIFQSIHEARIDFENFLAALIHHEIKRLLISDPNNKQIKDMLYQDSSVLLNNFSDDQLRDITFHINLNRLRRYSPALSKCDDINFLLIKELVQRDIALVRQAVGILIQAEHDIDIAPICTIHSFCNKALTQAFALEAGEAFQNKIEIDLDNAVQEAVTSVWRKIFYKTRYPRLIACLLKGKGPSKQSSNLNAYSERDIFQSLNTINSIRQSSVDQGIAGYVFTNLFCLLKKISGECKLSSFLSPCHFLLNAQNNNENKVNTNKNQKIKFKLDNLMFVPCENASQVEPSLSSDLDSDNKSLYHVLWLRYKKFLNALIKYNEYASNENVYVAFNNFLSALEDCIEFLIKQIYRLQNNNEEQIQELDNFLQRFDNKGQIKSLCSIDYQDGAQIDLDSDSKLWRYIFNLVFSNKDLLAERSGISPQERRLREQLSNCGFLFNTSFCMLFNYALDKYTLEEHLISANDLLRRLDFALNHRGDLSDNLATLIRARYPLAMIDEFQDTDPIQFNIFEKLYLNSVAKEQKAYCYLIGDPKQSIYAFRGSDINSYLKAKEAIALLNTNAIYTLDTNYRSSPDIVEGTNALFSMSLGQTKGNAFQEKNIYFEPVKPGKGSLDEYVDSNFKLDWIESEDLLNLDRQSVDESDFDQSTQENSNTNINDLEDPYLQSTPEDVLNFANFSANSRVANNYFIAYKHPGKAKASDFTDAVARICAFMVKRVLTHGFIGKDQQYHRVKPSDIAILVRKKAENDKLEAELSTLGIQSVYLSDSSLVTQASEECNCMVNLMEAICDPTNQHKLLLVLGSKLLSFDSESFKASMKDSFIEQEIVILNKCEEIWRNYGFVPAFDFWANHKLHLISRRLLGQLGGERFYTNIMHLCEIIQTKHGVLTDNQSQLRWFKELLKNSSEDFDSAFLQKRLESEQDLVRVLTIHKSKGLEFPIVFMPFLWVYVQSNKSAFNTDLKLDVVKFYDKNFKAPSLGNTVTFFDQYIKESLKENMRLAYVAITRARYANFFIIHNQSNQRSNMLPHSLISLFDAESYTTKKNASTKSKSTLKKSKEVEDAYLKNKEQELTQSVNNSKQQSGSVDSINDFDSKQYADIPIIMGPEKEKTATFEQVIEKLKSYPDLFTVVNGNLCLDAYQKELAKAEHIRISKLALIEEDSLGSDFNDDSLNISRVPSNSEIPHCAVSFLYKGSIDEKFYVHSYSSLTANRTHKVAQAQDFELDHEEDLEDVDKTDEFVKMKGITDYDYEFQDLTDFVTKNKVHIEYPKPCKLAYVKVPDTKGALMAMQEWGLSIQEILSGVEFNGSAYLQKKWDCRLYPKYSKFSYTLYPFLAFFFPKGKNPGVFLHKVLQLREFENMRKGGFVGELLHNVFNFKDKDYTLDEALKFYCNQSRCGDIEQRFHFFAYWLNEIVEAPILPYKDTYFALSDLSKGDYISEMKFFMSNDKFHTKQLNQICKQLAQEILPKHLSYLVKGLTLGNEQIKGYLTGSIDLCCRFDFANRPKIVTRLLKHTCLNHIASNIDALLACKKKSDFVKLATNYLHTTEFADFVHSYVEDGGHFDEFVDILSNHLRFVQSVALEEINEKEHDYKYYVIDYKSNFFGPHYDDYDDDTMWISIYEHRYDVQFLIYSLALYRYLKRRMGIDDNIKGLNEKQLDKKYKELKDFYDKNIGGVIYLFIRGMKTDYLRRGLSKGVFRTKIDFKYIWRLDHLFEADPIISQ